MDLTDRLKLMRVAAAPLALACAIVVVTPGGLPSAGLPDTLTAHGGVFYAITAVGYLTLPFVRRGDIAMMAMWLVLAAGVAPCFQGNELSAPRMFADMAGVFLAAAPVYIARFRQVLQGDFRIFRRRQAELDPVVVIGAGPSVQGV